jgi:hypothetical protein
MTHDPLCPTVNADVPFGLFHDDVPDDCLFCALIARVREDERKRSVLLVAAAYGKGLDAAREAVASYADETHQHVGMQKCWPESGDRCDITAAIKFAVGRINLLENT